jgi:hypothetical protein
MGDMETSGGAVDSGGGWNGMRWRGDGMVGE